MRFRQELKVRVRDGAGRPRPPGQDLRTTVLVPHHVDGVEEPLVADGPADGRTEFLQQHQRFEAFGRAVGHDPAAVPGAEGETALETITHEVVSVVYR